MPADPTPDADSDPGNAGEAVELDITAEELPVLDGGMPNEERSSSHGHRSSVAALTVAALGVVFGDIGTSPLYSLQTVFSIDHGVVQPTAGNVYGVISLLFWAITIVVSAKYVSFIMRIDNEGEGGIMALIALVKRLGGGKLRNSGLLVLLGVFGGALFYGDSIITPSISVLSAVEGLKVVSPSLGHLVVPFALVIIAALFAVQKFGTSRVGGLFGPVMIVWFAALAAAGARLIVQHPLVVRGLSPSYGLEFIFRHPYISFVALGAVVLVITGAEALYADMGHFGRPPIRRAWFLFVFPALTINYLGQAALILQNPKTTANPFFLLVPSWAQIPMVVLATLATVIASQAVISGAFSVSRQASQLGFLPRLTVMHTSDRESGQIYVPAVNWSVFTAVVLLILAFESSAKLATAYGVAVTGTFIIDTTLFLVVARLLWRWSRARLVVAGALFLTVDISFFAANLSKILHGGWFPLLVALGVFTIMSTWQKGREIVTRNRIEKEGSLREFVDEIHRLRVPRIPGTAIFPHPSSETTPLAMRANVEHNHVLHEHVVIVSVETKNVPYIPDDKRLSFNDLGYADDGIIHMTARFGFQETPNIPAILLHACTSEITHREFGKDGIDLSEASYFLSRITIRKGDVPVMRRWRKRLFVAISHNAASPVEYFCLPDERTVVMGSHVEL